jgi:hypothetical protein
MSTAGTKRKGSEKATPEEEESDADQQEGRAEGKDTKRIKNTAKPVDKEEVQKVAVVPKRASTRSLPKGGGKKAKAVKVAQEKEKAADDEEEKKEPVPDTALEKAGGKKAKSVKVVPQKAAGDEEEKKEPVPQKAAKKGASKEAPVDKTSANLPPLIKPANKDEKTGCCVISCSREHKGKGKVKAACVCAKCEKKMCDEKDCRLHFSGKNADICTNCAGMYVCVCVCVCMGVWVCVCVCVCVSLFVLCVC